MGISNYSRRLEQPYSHVNYIFEYYNTISNLPFILIGLSRLYTGVNDKVWYLYMYLTFCGICSGIHHAVKFPGSIILDYIPITASVWYLYSNDLFSEIGVVSKGLAGLALFVLYVDHVWQLMPVPWGHVMWHICAAYAADSCYQSIELTKID